jgi:hypothetical protein
MKQQTTGELWVVQKESGMNGWFSPRPRLRFEKSIRRRASRSHLRALFLETRSDGTEFHE